MQQWVARIKDRLSEEVKAHDQTLQSLREDLVLGNNYAGDVVDRAMTEVEQCTKFEQIRINITLRDAKQAALDRIATGDFQKCSSCRGQISEQRLEAVPTTEKCIGCKQRLEPVHHHLASKPKRKRSHAQAYDHPYA